MFDEQKIIYNKLIIEAKKGVKVISIDEILKYDKIVIFRTAWWRSFGPILEKLLSNFMGDKIYVIGREEDKLEVQKLGTKNIELISIMGDGPFTIENLEEQIEYLKKEGVDLVTFVVSGKSLFSYSNMFDVMNEFQGIKKFVFDGGYKIMDYDLLQTTKKVEEDYCALCDWFWNNVAEHKEYN